MRYHCTAYENPDSQSSNGWDHDWKLFSNIYISIRKVVFRRKWKYSCHKTMQVDVCKINICESYVKILSRRRVMEMFSSTFLRDVFVATIMGYIYHVGWLHECNMILNSMTAKCIPEHFKIFMYYDVLERI